MKTRAKRQGLKITLLVLLIVTVIAAIIVGVMLSAERELEDLRNDMLLELEAKKGEYDEQSIVLCNTSVSEAKAIAEKIGAKLRITSNGSFATLTLTDGRTIRDVYADDAYKQYLRAFSADYHSSVSELEEKLPVMPTVGNASEMGDHLGYMGIAGLWSSNTGNGITVAVIDTGIDTDNAEFTGRISEYSYNATFDKIVKDYTLENGEYDWSLVEDEHGHGTAVTGALAAANDGSGVVGVAPSVTVIVIKAECDENGRFERTSDLVFGLYYAIERDVSVVNMSFGTYSLTNPFAAATKLAYDSDVLCVAAAGNEGTASLSWPAADEYVIGVGALSEDSWALASYSNYGDNVDICAPGAVYTTSLGGEYKTETGTSLSSPLVAGALALLSYKDKYITFDKAYTLLTASSYDLGELGEDWYFGFGAIDTYALVSETRGTITYDMMTDELEDESGIFIVNHTLQRMLEPRRLYSVFDGWYYDPHYVEEFNYYEDRITASEITLYAKWVSEADGIPYTYRELDDGTIEITSYTGRRRFISIPEYIDGRLVTSIGDGAFMGESDLREINMPFGINNIGTAAFKDCSGLTKIEIPERVVSIGKEAFYNNVRLSSVAFLGSPALERIGSKAFAHCSSLTRIEIPEKVVSLDGSAFYGATSLYSITVNRFNKSYKSVDGVLFNASGSTLLAYPAGITGNYTVPEGVTAIGNHAFAFTLAANVELGEVQVIGSFAFSSSALTAVAIPDTVYSLGAYAFNGASYLSTATLGTGLSTVPESAFAFCSELTEIAIPSAIREIKANAFVNSGIERVSFSEDGALYYIGAAAFANTPVTELRFPVSLRLIYENAFSGCTNLASVSFADESDIDAIGVSAFASTVSLTTITLPEGLEELGDYAFSGSALTGNVDIPASLTYLGKGAFAHCASLETITVNEENTTYKSVDGVVYTEDGTTLVAYPSGSKATSYALLTDTKAVGGAAIVGAVSLKTLTLNSGLTELSELSISNNPAITSLSIPDSVTLISRFALANNPKMTSISFGTNSELDRLGYGALAYTSITSLTIPKNVSTIAQGAFVGSSKLTSVTFANDSKLEAVAAYTFDGCTALRSITFNSGSALKNIEAHGFEGLTALTSVSFGNAPLTNIDNFAFRFCDSLTSITIPEGVKSIGRYAFYACYALKTVNIPASVEHIGSFAFLGSKTLEVYFASENLPLYLDEDWDHGIKAYYLGVSEVLTEGNITYAKLTDGSIAILKFEVDPEDNIVDLNDYLYLGDITVIGSGAFAYTELYDIYFPETLRVIQKEAFMGTDVYFVELPASVEFIGSYAFADCPVEEIMFAENSSLKTIEQSAFENTAICVEVIIPASVENLGRAIFRGSSVPAVSFEDGSKITAIPEEMFANSGLEEIILPESVTKICDGAFMGTAQLISFAFTNTTDELWLGANAFYQSGISSIEIPANLTVIEDFALVALTNMTSFAVDEANPYYVSLDGVLYTKDLSKIVTVPAGMAGSFTLPLSVEKIGFGAFEGTVLESVIFPEGINLLSIGNRAFFGAKNLSEIEIPASVVAIDYYAFAYAKNLERVTFEAGSRLMGIYEGAFYGCASLSDIIIPDGVVEISDFAFYGADALKSFPVGENTSLRMLGSYAFAYTGLSGEFTLPASVTDLGSYAFLGADFKKVTIPADNREDLVIGLGAFGENNSLESIAIPFIGESKNGKTNTFLGYIFGAGGHTANATYVPESLKSVVLLEGATAVPQYAFYELAGLEEIDLPESVNSVYWYAFYNTSAKYEHKNPVSLWKINRYGNDVAETVASDYHYYFGKGISGQLELTEGITSIGSSTFSGCSSLTSIVIPEGVISISNYAFNACSSLISIVIPEGVTEIAPAAFYGCSSLTSIVIPKSLTSIGGSAFHGCSSIQSITIPEGVTSIGDHTFIDCSSLASIVIPKGVTEIGSYTFTWCSSLTNIVIPESVTSIGDHAFMGCSSIQSITIPEGVTSIGSYAFSSCSSLTNITIPEGVTSIGSYAFEGCKSLTSVVIPEGVASIGSSAFEGCSSLTSIVIPEGVASIGSSAFSGCSLYEVINNSDIELTIGSSDNGYLAYWAKVIIDKDGNKTYKSGYEGFEYIDTSDGFRFVKENGVYKLIAYLGNEDTVTLPTDINGNSYEIYHMRGVKNVIIPDGVTSIGNYAFQFCYSLTSITIPESVTSIGKSAFMSCSSLTSLVFPEGVTEIGDTAFNGCSSLASIVIPESMTSIGSSVFSECSALQSIVIPKGVTSIGSSAFEVCKSLTSIVIPEGVASIGSSAFEGCSSLTSVLISKSVTSIGQYAFNGCSSLTSIVIPEGVTSIETAAFTGCKNLTISINEANESFTEISGVIYNKQLTKIIYVTEGVTEILIPKTVTDISYAFNGCSNLIRVSFEEGSSIESIGSNAFDGCSSLTSIVIPESVTSIGQYAFNSCSSLASIVIPEGVTSIGNSAFSGCSSLTNITIPESTTSIGKSAFFGCSSLTNITIPEGVTSIGSSTFSGCSSLQSIVIPEGVTSIGNSAFRICSSLTSVVIPESVTEIGAWAFYNCSSLTSVVIPEGVTLINSFTFCSCSSLTSVVIPESVTEIGSSAFRGCSSLTSVVIPESVTEIGSSAFCYCSSLTSVVIPDSVTEIGSSAFGGCSSLRSITIPDSVTSIGDYAFQNCSSLTSITIPKGVTSIVRLTFSGCSSLYEVINKSDIELTFGSTANGYLAYYARVIIDKYGNKTYKSGYENFEYIDTADGFRFIEENEVYKLIAYLGNEDTVTLPTDINGNSYEIYHMRGVKNVIIPDGVTSIANNAFNGCESLTSIVIPKSVTSIGQNAFRQCSSLTSVNISYGVESIGLSAFHSCSLLKSIIIPGSVNSIGSQAFYNCSLLTSVGISYGVTSIGSSAFYDCTSLTNIVIPMSVTSIGGIAFTRTAYYNAPANWVNGALYIDGHLISVAEGTKYFEVKEGTYSIASDAFTNCATTLKHLTIGGNQQNLLSSFTNLETLVITELPTSHYIYGYFGSTSSIPQTLSRIVLKDGVKLSTTNSYTKKPFISMTGVTIYVEANEKDVRWDANFSNWSNGNTVVYGDKWISADFYDHEGNILSKEIFSTSQVIRIPYLKVDGNVQYSYIVDGYDIDGDGIVDVIPATSTTDISASAVVREVVNKYKVTVYDKDGETVIYEAELPYGTEITLPDPDEKRGYDFVGFIGFEDGMTVGGDVSFTANYDHVGDGHEYGEPVWVDPTCTDEGGYKHECTLCGEWYLTETVEPTGHDHALTVNAPTCTERGYNLYVCSCGDEYRDTYTDPKGHEWGAWVETLAPTCTEDGEEMHSCTDCDAVETRRVDCKGHNYVHIGSTAPTCGSNGGQTYKCLECGTIYNDESLAATGHNYKARRIHVDDLNRLLHNFSHRIRYEKPAHGSNYTYYVCSCGDIELVADDALSTGASVKSVCEHTAGEWGTFLPPTYLDGGIDIQTCTKCGYLLDAVATDPKELSSDFKFSGIALNLTEDINLIYTVSIPEGYEAPYMVFLFNGVEYTVTDYTVRADGKYTFKFSGINPQCMGDNVCATLYANVEGELVSICYAEYSVLKYCKTLLEHPTYGSNEKIVTLISDLLTYGANTQIYRNYKADALVTDGLALTPSVYNNVAENKTKVSGTVAEGLAWRGTGLYLTNAMSVYFTFTAEDTEDLAIAMKIGTRTTTVKVSDLKPDANGRYTVHLYNVMAHEFDKEITASFVRGGVEVGQTLTYSVNSYVISAEGYITDETLAALIKSIYNYGVAVEAYRG